MNFNVLLAGLVGYLLGSISFAVLVSKLAYRDDIRKHGSGNAGMTNTLRVYGGKAAVCVFAGDFLKGALAVWLGILLGGEYGRLLAALMVVVGHLFPIFFGFHGGKGVSTAAGAILVLNPLAVLILAVPFGLLLFFTRYMSLSSVTCGALFPVVTAVLDFGFGYAAGAYRWWDLATALAIGGLVVFMHRANIGRLINGTESKVGQKAEK